MNESKIILFNKKEECCACGACLNICPQKAISMYEDSYGFMYPEIDHEMCIKCGLCKKVCAFQNINEVNNPINTYVAISKDKKLIYDSASGGIFATIAREYLKNNGVVFGAIFDEDINPIHVGIKKIDLLYKIQGSKYVQSKIGMTYKETKQLLNKGYNVLFSGTPCQVAGLKGYLMKDYENLVTVDIICHGVPSAKFFKDYLNQLEKKIKGKLIEFKFRDKKIGWGLNGRIKYIKNGKLKCRKIYASESSYYNYFLKSECYRESCYSCKYACGNRPGDLTIGDYWGVENAHPELLKKIDVKNGVSVVVSNSIKGEKLLDKLDVFEKHKSNFEKAKFKNSQLKKPSSKGIMYEKIMNIYKVEGYEGVDNFYNKTIKIKKYRDRVKSFVPYKIKEYYKKTLV